MCVFVIIGTDNLFALPEFDALLREELALLPAHAARQPSGQALLLQPRAAMRRFDVDLRQLGVVRMHVERDGLGGDAKCAIDALPWQDDAFRLVVAQHAGDALPTAGVLIDELARVLAPGGVLLWYGLSPWSPWLAWIHWQARSGLPVPRVMHAEVTRMRLQKRQLTPAGIEHLGSCWPSRGEPSALHRTPWLAPLRAAYLLTASKQRAVLTPLRPRRVRDRVAIRPHLAAPSRRASA